MLTLYPLTFKFGEIGVQKITIDDVNFYKFIAESISKNSIKWADEGKTELPDLFVTTPLYKETIQANPNYISTLFEDWCENTARISEKNVFVEKSSLVILNLQGIYRLKQIGHISASIFKLLKGQNTLKIILLVNNSPLKEDNQFHQLFHCINEGSLCIVDKKGTVFASDSIELDLKKFDELNRLRLPLSYENILNKMIRKIGHYRIKTSDTHCNRYFYDGKYCEIEIKELLLDFIFRNLKDPHKLKSIIYGSTFSPWLIKAISALDAVLKNDLKEDFISYLGCSRIEDGELDEVDCKNDESVLLVLDFVDTGRTLKEATKKIFQKFNGLQKEGFHPISILINNDYKLSESGQLISQGFSDKRCYSLNSIEYNLTYFMGVNVAQPDTGEECDYCKLGLRPTNPLDEEETAVKLNSLDFWYLADNFEYKSEDDPSPGRTALKKVPRFEKWVENNSTFLAYRFLNNIEKFKKENGLDYVFVYPLEEHENNAAHHFALKLNYLYNKNIIAIPKSFINAIQNGMPKKELEGLEENWRKAISDISSDVDVVILDEFHKGGNTFQGIKKILNILVGDVKSYFILADFNPEKSKNYSEGNETFKVYSLYDFNIYN